MSVISHRDVAIATSLKQSMAGRYSDEEIDFVTSALVSKVKLEVVAKFCLRLYIHSNTGRYSLSYNKVLRKVLRKVPRENERSIQLLAEMDDVKAFPELYDNDLLTVTEKSTILRTIHIEQLTVINTLRMAITSHDDNVTVFGRHGSLYEEAYKYVALQSLTNNVPVISHPSDFIYLKDTVTAKLVKTDYMEFIISLSTKEKIKDDITEFQKRKYAPEIKLYTYWKTHPL